ncbi:uncharacterized protein LOC123864755 isoform X2 [Maniola jurtina]|uniref:uncharacterized protein LOC123864755 isoform X2 n=1 Tax=Maniola jurtina TaxID=191418 RepID=UPI001E68FA5F|nr:uncharacterized protein LOC123864755 isoform X2 [Maniola jurtina]
MTSRVDVFKTNDFLRRRKLRLQQVREQSKDIARKIRERAKIENLRHLDSIDARKEKEYFDCQEKLVKHLEHLYSKGLQKVGDGHKDALEITDKDCVKKTDISKLRGKEAAEALRRKKQEKLDEQKKLLDRKLQARDAANELSRELSTAVTKSLLTKQTSKKCEDAPIKPVSCDTTNQNQDAKKDNCNVTKNDMGTQWESEELPNEWEPNVPVLSLPKDDSVKESQIPTEKTDKSKRLNLFALSDEMPSSLRGGITGITEEDPAPAKTSLTLVSEYLQNRNLRLRQPEPSSSKKDDLQSIKQTILRTRAARTDGNVFDNVCHVLDKQVIPVPSWQAEDSGFCPYLCQQNYYPSRLYKSLMRTPVNKFLSSPITLQKRQSSPAPKEQHSHKRPHTLFGTCDQTGNKDKSSHSTEPNTGLSRKKSVTVYNHNTRNIQDLPCGDERIVSRDNKTEEDAYAQALKETTIANSLEKEQSSKHQKDMRSKVAITKNNVDREYRDTLAFLNSLAKNTRDKPIKTAYMDEHHQHLQNERHQRKLQEEFKKIEKECYKHHCKHSKRKATISEDRRNKTRSPIQREMRKDFEYSWMPVPESDGSLAVHTIPNSNSKTKSGNSVKFSQPDSYHEYRSRHKHTPPTKDVSNDRQSKRVVETVILQETNDSDVNDSSETSSVENLNVEKDKTEDDSRLKDAERIIIYKILESKKDKKSKERKKGKTNTRLANSASVRDEVKEKDEEDKLEKTKNLEKSAVDIQRGVSFEQLQEGVYEAVNSNGDNIASMYFTEGAHEDDARNRSQKCNKTVLSCCCSRNKDFKDAGDNTRLFQRTSSCKCSSSTQKENSNVAQPSAATSATSFTTAFNDKTNNRLPDGGFVKLIEDEGQESNKFYVGASGFLKNDNYEVVIQLRKKDTEKVNNIDKHQPSPHSKPVNSLGIIQEMEQNLQDNGSSNTTANDRLATPLKVVTSSEENKITHNVQQDNAQLNKEHSEVEMPEEPNLDSPSKKLCEKAVHTSFQDDFAIPANVPKSDPISRPGTSTYTQTSFNLSIPKPAFMHMSSSTSTAYMSPPELVLPKFLKQNYIITKEELYESENTMNQLDSNFDVIESEHCNRFDCRCRVNDRYLSKTPPNTARSCSKESSAGECVQTKKRKCKCHNCRSHSDTNVCRKIHRKKSCTSKIKSSRGLPSEDINAMLKRSPKSKPLNTRSTSKRSNNINPVVKDYVNKLLALNSEGLKAIEIINQDCSAISTPGSSIINLPCNKNKDKSNLESKISLEQIKNVLKQQILKENLIEDGIKNNGNSKKDETENKSKTSVPIITQNSFKLPKKKSLHKVKSLNISKHILKKKKPSDAFLSSQRLSKPSTSVSSSAREENKLLRIDKQEIEKRSKTSTTPRKYAYPEYKNSTSTDIVETSNSKRCNSSGTNVIKKPCKNSMYVNSQKKKNFKLPAHRTTMTSFSSDSDATGAIFRHLHPPQPPTHISTQTNGLIDTEIHFMKIAEDKLQNMEKIADLTEKCTKRLSNLAKVLEEVRRNKSLVYNHISSSDSTPESETKADNNELSTEISGHISDPNILTNNKESVKNLTSVNMPEKLNSQNVDAKKSEEFTPLLKDIPKPDIFTAPFYSKRNNEPDKATKIHNIESDNTKSRGKPPPALSRIHLKCGEDINIIPHELSTVVEVDSPMSMKVKSQSSRQDTKLEVLEKSDHFVSDENDNMTAKELIKVNPVDPDLLKTNYNLSRRLSKVSSTDSSDDSKIRMMDMKKFNDIMLKPFISLKEYAKQCNIGLDEGSNFEDVVKDNPINDDLSSLHSDGSLPDVIAELLKRKIITEPFKYDTGSNVNSTTVSSESTLSVLALSKARKEKKKSAVFLKNKENIVETSGTLSISSNPDLENAFQKLGMGWASSTLKKTKERLALSSSSNTSSSSMTQFKMKSFSQDVPNLATDSTSSLLEVSNKRDKEMCSPRRYQMEENSRNAVQQTSLTNSMTVKEFLTNELAKKITFNNKSTRKGEEDFVSLYETKMPEEMKHTKVGHDEEQSSAASVNHNRARTSTPVQIFKSQTYHSTSTSNTSNGFFSNADDLSSVKVTSASIRNHSTSDKDDLTIPSYSLKTKKGLSESGCSKSD